MLEKTNFTVSVDLIDSIPIHHFEGMKTAINEPTGNFFYDPWKLKPEYQGSSLEELLTVLPSNIGEARIIILDAGRCYNRHADIDDRYHLNLFGDEGYLIDLESKKMYHTVKDGIWYKMNAGILHTAASFGEHKRIQLVVRELLSRNELKDPVNVSITSTGDYPRYKFDNLLSPWLNSANKRKIISNFSYKDNSINFLVERSVLKEVKDICLDNFLYKEV
jgi:hypothetical protein